MKREKMQTDIKRLNLKPGMIDSHFHLYHMKNREMKAFEIIDHCFQNGLEYALDIGINSDNFEARIKSAENYPGLYTAHGYYPSECVNPDIDIKLAFLAECLQKDSKAIALGEIGLDFFHDYGTGEQQRELLRKQLILADQLDLPVIIHSREAEAATLEILAEYSPARRGIIHCFSYSPETALKFVEMGYYISFAGNLTYKKSDLIKKAAVSVPIERILVETDAPYLSPEGVRHKKNHPGYIGYTYSYMSELRGIPLETLVSRVKSNFMELFRLS